MLRSIRWLREQNFDLVIDLQCLLRSAAFAWLARGKFLVGLDNPREGGREGARLFYDFVPPRSPDGTHAVERYLSILEALDVPVHKNFQWLPERPPITHAEVKRKWPAAFPTSISQLPSPNWILLQPGARWDNKRWPVENFAELVRLLAKEFPETRFAILGGNDDKPLGEIVSRAEPNCTLNLCGETSLPEMIEWLRLCDLLVTNDTGPMHVAAAHVGKPLVALFRPGLTRSSTGPHGQLENVLRIELPCSPCMKSVCTWKNPIECLTAISPAMVFERIKTIYHQDTKAPRI